MLPLARAMAQLDVSFRYGLTRPVVLTAKEFAQLPRVTVTADFHCAAGWSYEGIIWSGFRFMDAWNKR